MKTSAQKIHEISKFICNNGILVNKAQSAYGADRWELGLLSSSLEDDGYTTCVYSRYLGLRIADCCGTVDLREGNIEDLDTLYDNLFGEE